MTFKKTIPPLIILALLLLAACGGTSSAEPTSAPKPSPTEPIPEPTAEPTLEPTAVSTPTTLPDPTTAPDPTAVSTPEPTAIPEPIAPAEGPALIEVAYPDLFPEGIEYDAANGRFLLSSIGEGTIYAIDDDGTFTPFIEDAELLSSIGLEIDAANNRLYVANSAFIFTDPTLASAAYLGIYDLTTGERIDMINLMADDPDGEHFANDVAVDADGNAYVTDSAGGLYKVDADGAVTPFAAELGLDSPNGIVYHPDGYLIVANPGTNSLYKIPTDDPASGQAVNIGQDVAVDGMVWHPNGALMIYDYGTNAVLALSSEDGWETAVIQATSPDHPAATLAARGEQIYAVYPHFDALGGTPPDAFEIVLVVFDE